MPWRDTTPDCMRAPFPSFTAYAGLFLRLKKRPGFVARVEGSAGNWMNSAHQWLKPVNGEAVLTSDSLVFSTIVLVLGPEILLVRGCENVAGKLRQKW